MSKTSTRRAYAILLILADAGVTESSNASLLFHCHYKEELLYQCYNSISMEVVIELRHRQH